MVAPTSFFADYGCHVRILEEARVLQQLGHHVTIVTYHNGGAVPELDIRRSLPVPWRRTYEVGSSRHKIGLDALLFVKTLQLLRRNHFDVLHAHLHEGALVCEILGRIFNLPFLFDFQGSMTAEMLDHGFIDRRSPAYRPLRTLETWLDRRAPAILTSSEHARRLLLQEFGCRPERVRALPDCVNSDVFLPAAAQDQEELAALRRALAIPPDRRLVVYLGLLAEYQGTGLLLQAMARLLQQRSDVHLLLMGFPNVDTYQKTAEDLGIASHVTFTGRVPYGQAPLHLALGDVAVAPKLSLTEGSGKLLNYMAVALPIVAFDTPVAREYLGGLGSLAERGSIESLAWHLDQQLPVTAEGGAGSRQTGERLRQRAVQHYGWEQAGIQIVNAYQQVLSTQSHGKLADRDGHKCNTETWHAA